MIAALPEPLRLGDLDGPGEMIEVYAADETGELVVSIATMECMAVIHLDARQAREVAAKIGEYLRHNEDTWPGGRR